MVSFSTTCHIIHLNATSFFFVETTNIIKANSAQEAWDLHGKVQESDRNRRCQRQITP